VSKKKERTIEFGLGFFRGEMKLTENFAQAIIKISLSAIYQSLNLLQCINISCFRTVNVTLSNCGLTDTNGSFSVFLQVVRASLASIRIYWRLPLDIALRIILSCILWLEHPKILQGLSVLSSESSHGWFISTQH
jgi:hypothetical protein